MRRDEAYLLDMLIAARDANREAGYESKSNC